jgi:hypothetical protein
MIGRAISHYEIVERIKAKEYEFAAAHLGAPVVYTGRPLTVAHGAHPIMGGHFQRRLEILRQTLREAGAPAAVVTHWIDHTEQLRASITQHEANDCRHDVQASEPHHVDTAGSGGRASVPARRELPLVGTGSAQADNAPQTDEEGKSQ